MERAIRLAEENVANGGGPYGAVLVAPDGRWHHPHPGRLTPFAIWAEHEDRTPY